MTVTILYCIDRAKRMHRFYRLDVQPDLFGQWCLMHKWGRIGTTGRERPIPFPTRQQAQDALISSAGAKSGEDMIRDKRHAKWFYAMSQFRTEDAWPT